jgi:hypothetical protein
MQRWGDCLVGRLTETFNFGDTNEMTIPELMDRLSRMYTDLAVAINQKPDLYQRTTNGQVGDVGLSQGAFNINLNTNRVEMLTNHTSGSTVTWTTLS